MFFHGTVMIVKYLWILTFVSIFLMYRNSHQMPNDVTDAFFEIFIKKLRNFLKH